MPFGAFAAHRSDPGCQCVFLNFEEAQGGLVVGRTLHLARPADQSRPPRGRRSGAVIPPFPVGRTFPADKSGILG